MDGFSPLEAVEELNRTNFPRRKDDVKAKPKAKPVAKARNVAEDENPKAVRARLIAAEIKRCAAVAAKATAEKAAQEAARRAAQDAENVKSCQNFAARKAAERAAWLKETAKKQQERKPKRGNPAEIVAGSPKRSCILETDC